MSAIYTRRGDAGTINYRGQNISKASLFSKVLGCIDELNVMIGWVKTGCSKENTKKRLRQIQSTLFDIAARLTCEKAKRENPSFSSDFQLKIKAMEDEIDLINEAHEPLKHFLYPGKDDLSVRWHMARVVCRHAERRLVEFSQQHKVSPVILAYMNRLSDWFFMKAYEAEKEA